MVGFFLKKNYGHQLFLKIDIGWIGHISVVDSSILK